MKFQIEQIAIVPKDPIAAKKLLSEIGATEWSEDHVVATGNVFGVRDTNEADLLNSRKPDCDTGITYATQEFSICTFQ